MRLLQHTSPVALSLLALGSSGFVTSASQSSSCSDNLCIRANPMPEGERLEKRRGETPQELAQQQPLVVKKMSLDPGEMFFLDYWSFSTKDYGFDKQGNLSTVIGFDVPILPHSSFTPTPRLLQRYLHLPIPAANLLAKREFVCPSGTNTCTSIDRPNVCCPSSSTCQIVPNTGLGDVGCCDAAQACAGSLSQCPSGYNSCPNYPGGGCCLPGFACFQEGCVQTSTTVVVITPTPSTTSSSLPPPTPSTVTDTTTVIVVPPTPSSSISSPSSTLAPTTITATTTLTSSVSSTSPSSQSSPLICASGSRSCPTSLGGHCCPNDRACGPSTCTEQATTGSLSPPVRGTSSSPSTTSTPLVTVCPTGFYACSAYNPGGCCQVDRACSSTSCPPRSGVTVVNSGSLTIVAPTGTSVGRVTGACAQGWQTCDANVGGGCCPSGFACGTAACTASVSGLTATQGKVAPNDAATATSGVGDLIIYTLSIWAIGWAVIM